MNINALAAFKIKQLRHKLGLSSEAMAKDLGISRTAFSQLENGKVEITLNRIETIANRYAVPLSELIPSARNNNQIPDGCGNNSGQEENLQMLLMELQEIFKKHFKNNERA